MHRIRDGILFGCGIVLFAWGMIFTVQNLMLVGVLMVALPIALARTAVKRDPKPIPPAARRAISDAFGLTPKGSPVTEKGPGCPGGCPSSCGDPHCTYWGDLGQKPEDSMRASEPETWCRCGSTEEAVPVTVVYDPDKPPVEVAYLCPGCSQRRRPAQVSQARAKAARAPIPWGEPGQFYEARKRLREVVNEMEDVAEATDTDGRGNTYMSAEQADRYKALAAEADEIKRQIEFFEEAERVAALPSGPAAPSPPTVIVQGDWIYEIGWHAEDDLCNEDEHQWEAHPGGGELCLRCEARRRPKPECETIEVYSHGSNFPTRTYCACGVDHPAGEPHEHEPWPGVLSAAMTTNSDPLVSLHGGRADGRTVRLLDTPPTIKVFGETYEQITDPDTGEFLGGYAAVMQCVACAGRGKAHGYECSPCGGTGRDPLLSRPMGFHSPPR